VWVCGRSMDGIAGSIPAVGLDICCECCVLSGRGLCVGLITRPEESYRFGVSECDREASIMARPWPTRSCCALAGSQLTNIIYKRSVKRNYFTV